MEASGKPALGEVVDDKYRIEGLIGEGAMGSVYRAQHVFLGHRVALKVLRASADSEELRFRFFREARATMALRSEHIVRVFDLGIIAPTTPYMVLEHLEGVDLRSLLDTAGPLPIEEAVDYAIQACEALSEAHSNGIVHRDLKPHNLFRTTRPDGTACIKLLDFGVSKFEEPTDQVHELTSSQVMLGSPVFMPPEQIRSPRTVDPRADVWSLGVVLYMLVGGGRPFGGEGLPALCASIMVDPPRPLSDRCPSVPKELEAVIHRCLEKARELRLPNAAEVARALAPFASAEGRAQAERIVALFGARAGGELVTSPHAPTEPPAGAVASEPASERTSMASTVPIGPPSADGVWQEPSAPPSRRLRRPLGALALALAAVVAGTAFMSSRAGSSASAQASAPVVETPALEIPTSAGSALLGEPPSPPPLESVAPPRPHAKQAPRPRSVRRAAPSMKTKSAPKKEHAVDRNGVPILD